LPPKPARYFNDYAQVISAEKASRLNETLANFERATSSQILVVIFPKLPATAALEDFAIRAAQSWRVGQKEKDNGAILFVFVRDRRMRIEVGYGLEGVLPDALARRILDNEIAPRLRQNDYEGGVTAGVNAIMQAVRGEYKSAGRERSGLVFGLSRGTIVFLFILFFLMLTFVRRRGTSYHRRRQTYWGGGWFGGGGGGFSGGGGSSGFSGGGGRFGGGGASGSW
jgi:uncharacterized protein